MVLPVTAMVIGGFASLTILTKNSFLEEIHKQYVVTARAKGLDERRVLYGHVFRNAMLIVIAGFPAAFIGVLFTGALLIEVIFSLDGLGLLGFEAALNRDYPVMFATLYFFTLMGLLLGLDRRSHLHARRPAHRLRIAGSLSSVDARSKSGTRARWWNFRRNRRAFWSLWLFLGALLRDAAGRAARERPRRCWCATTATSTSRSRASIPRRPSAGSSRPRRTTPIPKSSR